MIWFRLSFRRLRRSAVFILSMIIMLLGICGGGLCDRAYKGLRAGFIFSGEGDNAERVCDELYKYGFERYYDESEMITAVRLGNLDCAVSFSDDLEERLLSVRLDESFRLYISPLSTAPLMFKEAVCTELLCVSAPHINFPLLEGLAPGSDFHDDILENYRKLWERKDGFSVSFETVDGAKAHEAAFSESFVSLIISLFLFVIPLMQGCRKYLNGYRGIKARIGKIDAFRTVFLPEMLITLICELIVIATGLPAAALISGNASLFRLLLPSIASALLLCLLDIGIILVMPSADSVQILMIPILLLTLAACPLIIDLSSILPFLRILRPALPTYWLIALTGRTAACCLTSALAAAVICLAVRWCLKGNKLNSTE